ncbi:hypothetical protein ncot_04125 [Nocardioides sp. JQ2195]|uniref:hypothetical protein n=1 Tax=Nocardioides sp. JQ2195 TaxID=2592334 RepID=UPI00143E7C14|nr:hypothetical protein [Nocardioides sp. JQ2195]QIX25875.1 hypothetical protein ncot_04125 [Nocardioides sp. JQ2195]
MKVRDHTGQTWRVTRRWVPWRRRLKGFVDAGPNLPSGLGDDPISLVIGLIGLIIMLPFVILALVAGLELLLVLLVLPFAILGRVLLGRHWTVEARKGFRPWSEVKAGGWSDSRQKIQDLAAAIERGDVPPRTLGEDRTSP